MLWYFGWIFEQWRQIIKANIAKIKNLSQSSLHFFLNMLHDVVVWTLYIWDGLGSFGDFRICLVVGNIPFIQSLLRSCKLRNILPRGGRMEHSHFTTFATVVPLINQPLILTLFSNIIMATLEEVLMDFSWLTAKEPKILMDHLN